MALIRRWFRSFMAPRPVYVEQAPDPLCVPGQHYRQHAYVMRMWRVS